MEPECKVRLRVFEGPLDLLLHLINKNKLDIKDIPISLVTNQYLEYLSFLKALNIEVAAEYLVMAATLMHIKSKMLLPSENQKLRDDEIEDPRLEITRALEELKKAKEYADMLNAQPVLERDVYIRPDELLDEFRENIKKDEAEYQLDVNLVDLIDAFRDVLKGQRLPMTIEIERARISLDDRIKDIKEIVQKETSISFFSLFRDNVNRIFLIVTFLAILELAKRGVIRLFQAEGDSDIMIVRRHNAIH